MPPSWSSNEFLKDIKDRQKTLEKKMDETLNKIIELSQKTNEEIREIERRIEEKLDHNLKELAKQNNNISLEITQLKSLRTDVENVKTEVETINKIVLQNQKIIEQYQKEKERKENTIDAVKTHNIIKFNDVILYTITFFVLIGVSSYVYNLAKTKYDDDDSSRLTILLVLSQHRSFALENSLYFPISQAKFCD